MRNVDTQPSDTERSHYRLAGTAKLNEDGVALPFTIFLVTIITIMLAAAFSRTTAEHLVASNSAAENSALAVAQSGLQDYLANPPTERPGTADSVRYNYPGGYTMVYPELLYHPEDTASGFTYIVRSVGNLLRIDSGAAPIATRTIAQFARWRGGDLPGVAALIALNGIEHTNDITHINPEQTMWFDGDDDLTCASPVAPILGYRGPGTPGDDPSTHTDSSSASPASERSGTAQDIADELGIDWTLATDDSVIDPDYTSLTSSSEFPTFLIDGDQALDVSGSGLLVVTGDLYLEANITVSWDGLILVGGRLIPVPNTGGTTRVFGMVVTGLNELDGTTVPRNPMAGQYPALEIQYSSCNVRTALEPFVGFYTIDNTWVDNWATY